MKCYSISRTSVEVEEEGIRGLVPRDKVGAAALAMAAEDILGAGFSVVSSEQLTNLRMMLAVLTGITSEEVTSLGWERIVNQMHEEMLLSFAD